MFLRSLLSISDQTDFDRWLASMVRQQGRFTALIVLTQISGSTVAPLCSTYVHIIGDDIDWSEIALMFAGSGQRWDGAAFFPTTAANGGPIDNPTAHRRLRELEQAVIADRMVLNDGYFFDVQGRQIRVDPADGA